MKLKFAPIFLSFSCLFSLGSCGEKKEEKTIIERKENITSLFTLSKDELNEKIGNARSFLLTYGELGCTSCIDFKDLLKNVAIQNDLVIYTMDIQEYRKTNLAKEIQVYNLGFLVIDKGDVKENIAANKKWSKEISAPRKEESIQSIEKFLSKTCFLSSPFYTIDKDTAFNKINTKDTFYIYYMRYTCGDCQKFDSLFLEDWILKQENSSLKIYLLDMDLYRPLNPDDKEQQETYQTLKDELGLSINGNADFGYDNGVVPTLQKYVEGVLTNMAVIFNDHLEMHEDGSVTVLSGYYKDAPFYGNTYDTYGTYQSETLSFYQDKFIEFFK